MSCMSPISIFRVFQSFLIKQINTKTKRNLKGPMDNLYLEGYFEVFISGFPSWVPTLAVPVWIL